MLVLTQKEGEVLQIGSDIRIYIKRVKGNWVRLCIDAPREVPLLRIPAERAPGASGAALEAGDAPPAPAAEGGDEP
jgi:carbon storage regulator